MEQTARLAIPLLVPGQLHRDLFHNETIQWIEMLLCPTVEGTGPLAPPRNPEIGSCYVIPPGASGEWSEHQGALSCFTKGGWRFVEPFEGLQLFDKSSGQMLAYRMGRWEAGIIRCRHVDVDGEKVLGPRQPAIAEPSGGAIVDAECRTAIASVLTALRTHGLIG